MQGDTCACFVHAGIDIRRPRSPRLETLHRKFQTLVDLLLMGWLCSKRESFLGAASPPIPTKLHQSHEGRLPLRRRPPRDSRPSTWRLPCSSCLVMTCFLVGDCKILPKKELRRSLQVWTRCRQGAAVTQSSWVDFSLASLWSP